jgi:signal transduction histidine kinase
VATQPETDLRLPFRPRARLLQLLGDQLIGSPRLAVFELVKNGYDADAEDVIVTLAGISGNSPTITVLDNGDGMTLDIIRDVWLVPAHDYRARQRLAGKRTRLNRLPLGEKGVGRFAVHKLGDKIELITRAAEQPEVVVEIDWRTLLKQTFLAEAEVSVRTRSPEVFLGKTTGTKIVVSELREKSWSRGEVRRLFRQITSISSPFSKRSDRFEAILEVPDQPEWVQGIPDVHTLVKAAPWHFQFSFDGKISWEYQFRGIPGVRVEPRMTSRKQDALQINEPKDTDERGSELGRRSDKLKKVVADADMLDGIGPIKGEIYVWDRDREVLAKLGETSLIQNFLDENGGIRVYRDGIRVYSYGEPGDDWLGLDLRRIQTPARNISRNIVLGAVDLSLERSIGLVEKTNREGFVETDAYNRLKQLVLGAISLLEVERKIDKDKIRAVTGSPAEAEAERIQKPLEQLRTVAKAHKLEAELEPSIRKIEIQYTDMRDAMLRAGLSGLGLAVVFHEIEHGVRVLYEAIEAGTEGELVRDRARELVRILDGFSELLRKGESKKNSLQQLIRRAHDINRPRFRTHKVRLVCPPLESGGVDATSKFSFSLALGAFNSLLDNAFYWLKVRWPETTQDLSPRAIYIDINDRVLEGPAIVIADNGTGFQDDPERLTKPFFSRRPEGMGLGLYYANLVMELNAGRLVFPDREDIGVPAEFDGAVLALVFPQE